jgi:hypothetical protein
MTKQKVKPKKRKAAARKTAANGGGRGSITELARSRGVSRSLVNRAIEVGAMPSELFELRDRQRHIRDFAAAGAALDAFLEAGGAKLGRPPAPPFAALGVNLADEQTWPADGPILAAIKMFFSARDSKRAADALEARYVSAARLREVGAEAQVLEQERLRGLPEACAGALVSKLGVDIESARKACAPMAAAIERIIADTTRAYDACFAPTREGGS